jgi:hypothetical protein
MEFALAARRGRRVVAIVPAPLLPNMTDRPLAATTSPVGRGVRIALLLVAGGLVGIFILAELLNPYGTDGKPLRLETHRQLGFPRCTFYDWTGSPCPSCGMTTSFALLVRGDVLSSCQANSVGTLLALFCLFVIPWSIVCVARGRLYFVRSLEPALTVLLAIFLALMLLRWGLVLWLGWGI